jgi:hypothetical protein
MEEITTVPALQFTGAEHFIAGIAPAFWSHIPLTISQINILSLIDGMHCLLLQGGNSDELLAVSKCSLVATIVSAERKSNGAVQYAVDDGTGVIDVMHWVDDFILPSLLHDCNEQESMPIGTTVKIYARIECLALLNNENASSETLLVRGRHLQSFRCTRELHANRLVSIRSPNEESTHWIASTKTPFHVSSSVSVLQRLGPNISKQIADRDNLPSADDADGSWQVFGTKCLCRSPYKEKLLCKCALITTSPVIAGFVTSRLNE